MHPFIRECVPPILFRLKSKISKKKVKNVPRRYTPFNYLPRDINVRWIMDIGANDGSIAKSGLLSFRESKVICFEPVSTTFNLLKQNLSAFGNRTILHQMAVSDFNGESEINLTTCNPANSLIGQSKFYEHYNPSIKPLGKEKVKVIKLDDFIPDLPASHFDIVKIDVEGLELSVLRGGEKFFFKSVDMIMIEIAFQREFGWKHQNYLEVFKFLDSLGYRLINIYDVYNIAYDQEDVLEDMMITQIDCVFRKRIN